MMTQQPMIGTISGLDIVAAEEKRRRDRSLQQIETMNENRKQRNLQNIARNDPIKIEYSGLPTGAQKTFQDWFPNREIQYQDDKWLVFSGLNLDIKMKLYKIPLPDEHKKKFYGILENVYTQMLKRYDEQTNRVQSIRQADQDHMKFRENTLNFVENELREQRSEQVIQVEQKRKRPRIFTDKEKQKLIGTQSYSLEDLQRSRQNLVEQKTKILSRIGKGE